MKVYAGCMNIGGKLLLSGFYTDDAELLIEEGRRYGLELVSIGEKDRWCRVMLQKK
jgi:ribosomal protein L11 methylase PrmA